MGGVGGRDSGSLDGHVHTAMLKLETNKTYGGAHRTLLNVLWQPGWEGSLAENGYMCMHD